MIEKCDLCAVYPPFFDSRGLKQDERACVTIRVQSIFLPCNITTESDHTAVSRKSDDAENRVRKKLKREKKECRAGETDASSAAEI